MRQISLDAVEFIGGPLDGLLRFVDCPVNQLERFVATPMNHVIAQMPVGRRTAATTPATSVAFYELRAVSRDASYAFLGSVAPSRFESIRSLRMAAKKRQTVAQKHVVQEPEEN